MVVPFNRFHFTVERYNHMIDRGVLTENDRVELIRGEIVNKMSIGDQHVVSTNRLTYVLHQRFLGQAIFQIQGAIRLADSQPEPDLAVLEFRADFYSKGRPTPASILLVIEVADSSLENDREIKGPLYAENGIREYWIVNLLDRQIEIFRQPHANGTYSESLIRRVGEQIDLLAFPGVLIPVDDLLP